MKLTKVRITEFQSIQDSTEFEIDDVTCLVGKNEAGKTALLKALYRLNPINAEDGNFNVTNDYPSRTTVRYRKDVKAERRDPAQVVQATYALEQDDIAAVQKVFGSKCLKDEAQTVTLCKGYSNKLAFKGLNVDTEATLSHLVRAAGLPETITENLLAKKAQDMMEIFESAEYLHTDDSNQLKDKIRRISESSASDLIFDEILRDRIPKFLYFDEYYQMKGQDNLNALKNREAANQLEDSDYPLLGLIDLAGLDLDELINSTRTQDLIAELEAAENELTETILPYWSQNQHLQMEFDIRQALPEDPPGMTSGMNIWALVKNTKYNVSIPLGTRSRGFIWFFSFLAWYSKLRQEDANLILLLDEPGLSLHAKAQGDLLRYFEEELKPHHQLIYTTHSPFMIDPKRFDSVRIVQDLSIESKSGDLSDELQGTKVTTEVLEATADSLFPLQGALGYDLYQTLFIGPNNLVVEGVSDLLYIQTISDLLQEKGKKGLSSDWTITPVGGSNKVPTFVALIGAQSQLNVAVLIDSQRRDQQKIENLYKKKLLKKNQVLTYADFVTSIEADIEDMFDVEFYLQLVNDTFEICLTAGNLPAGPPRIVKRIEQYMQDNPLPNGKTFNHYRPALYFSMNIESLKSKLDEPQLDRFQKAFDALNALL